jgi:hypothetical protein
MEDGHIVVDSIESIRRSAITNALARESGFASVEDLLETASHGPGRNVYLIRFHYLPAGAWDTAVPATEPEGTSSLLQRIRHSKPPAHKKPRSGKRRTA